MTHLRPGGLPDCHDPFGPATDPIDEADMHPVVTLHLLVDGCEVFSGGGLRDDIWGELALFAETQRSDDKASEPNIPIESPGVRAALQELGEWAMVPKQPTEEMIAAAATGRVLQAYVGAKEKADKSIADRYRAMLAAAPARAALSTPAPDVRAMTGELLYSVIFPMFIAGDDGYMVEQPCWPDYTDEYHEEWDEAASRIIDALSASQGSTT